MSSAASRTLDVIRSVAQRSCQCPAHSQTYGASAALRSRLMSATPAAEPDYAFEMATSTVRIGPGVAREVGQDLQGMKAKSVCVLTDPNLRGLPIMETVLESLERNKVNHQVFDGVFVEPTDESITRAIDFARSSDFDAFLAVGGGSVMDTAKIANLFACDREAELIDYVNAPIGHGKPINFQLLPLIAVPTTAGTGSETTGVAIFDYKPANAKTGIANRALKPTLGLVDTLATLTMPRNVAAYSGYDVLCHALESYTAIPYNERTPRPKHPLERPAYQGSNPISDVWALKGLEITAKYLKRSVDDAEDVEAREAMHMASAYAGIGFGSAGVHLCHGLSYPISGMVDKFNPSGYPDSKSIVPHGLSVVITAPAVFNFTAPACPDRHLNAAQMLGADISNAKEADAGLILSDALIKFMSDMNVENGLSALGFTRDDIPEMVKGALPQHRVTKLSPNPVGAEEIASIYENAMTIY